MDNTTSYGSWENSTTQVWCVYPVSGSYTQFQRILFWVVIILILFFQFHDWLTAGAIAFAITYSVAAALHAVILAPQANSLYDSDLFVLQEVLQSSIFATVLCLIFSPRLFGQDVFLFYFAWCLLIFVARMVIQYSNFGLILDLLIPLSCDDAGICPNPCANMSMSTTFRRPDEKLQPIIWWPPGSDLSTFAAQNNWLAQAPQMSEDGYSWLFLFWFWYFAVGPIVQSALINAKVVPRDARNRLFRRVRQKYVVRDLQKQSKRQIIYVHILIWVRYFWVFLKGLSLELQLFNLLVKLVIWIVGESRGRRVTRFYEMAVLEVSESKWRYVLAKTLATIWYIWAVGSYIFCAVCAIYITANSETDIQGWLLDSEGKKAAGQWSPWMVLALAVTAAATYRLTSGRKKEKTIILLDDPILENQKQHELAMMAKQLEDSHWHMHRYLIALFVYEWADFRYWWENTIEASSEVPSNEQGTKVEKNVPLASLEQAVLGHSSARAMVNVPPPRAQMSAEYSYEDDEELQRLLYDETEVKGKEKRRKKASNDEMEMEFVFNA